MKIEIRSGDFLPHAASRLKPVGFVLFTPEAPGPKRCLYKAAQLTAFRVNDGYWARKLDQAGSWASALSASTLAGAPGAAINTFLPDFLPGQKGLVTWANAVLGGVAATAVLASSRNVTFAARFSDGRRVSARGAENDLTLCLSRLLSARLSADT